MITPRFTITQDESSITLTIRAPYCSLKELDVSIDGEKFIFTCSPYFLRLCLPGKIVEDNKWSNGSFNIDAGEFTFNYKKMIAGEHFKGLDLITKLISPKTELKHGERIITVISSEANDNELPSNLAANPGPELGFAMLGNHNNLKNVISEFSDVFEIDPFEVPLADRRKMRIQYEQGSFDAEHYLADFFDDLEINEIIAAEAPWSKLQPQEVSFTAEELDFLKDLGNVEYQLTTSQLKYCHNNLIDMLFAYCYDRRTTDFEGTIESGWTVIKLAASLSWFDGFNTPKESILSAYRRSVTYPLYRSFKLNDAVFQDLKDVLRLGSRYIIKSLITMYKVFLKGDCCRYVINNLFIKDYIRYIMKWDETAWSAVVAEVNSIVIEKSELGLNLTELEKTSDICSNLMNTLRLAKSDSEDSDDTDSSSDTDTSSYESSSDTSDTDDEDSHNK